MSVQIDGSTGNIIAIKADYSGDVSIGGTLTYEDVTNIDAVGLITARNGIKVDDLGVQVGTGATIDGATNTLTFLTNGSEKLRINSGGQISIRGTNTAFDTTGDLNSLQLYYEQDSGQASIGPYSNGGNTHLSFYTNSGGAAATEKLRITSNGDVGIDCIPNDHNNFSRVLDVNGPSGAAVYMRTNDSTSNVFIVGNYGSDAYLNNRSNGNLRLYTNSSERIRITNTGRVGINTTTPTVSLDLSNNTDAVALPTGTTAQRPSGTDAYIRKNSTNNALEFYNGTEWVEIITDYFPTGSTILG